MVEYNTAVVCEKGHPINVYAATQPESTTEFCGKCGAKAVAECPACGTSVRGAARTISISTELWEPAAYCMHCGRPYVWTELRIEGLRSYIDESEDLDPVFREAILKSVPDLIAETPLSDTAVLRVKQAINTISAEAGKGIMNLLMKVCAEAVKAKFGLL